MCRTVSCAGFIMCGGYNVVGYICVINMVVHIAWFEGDELDYGKEESRQNDNW